MWIGILQRPVGTPISGMQYDALVPHRPDILGITKINGGQQILYRYLSLAPALPVISRHQNVAAIPHCYDFVIEHFHIGQQGFRCFV